MSPPIFRTRDVECPSPFGPARLVEFELPGGATTPQDFAAAVAANIGMFVAPGRGVILSGRGPVWGYAMMVHAAHPSPWVATADPRLEGAVIVQSHRPGVSDGTLISPLPSVS